MDDIFTSVNLLSKGALSPPVEKQLVEPAKYIFVCLHNQSAKFDGNCLVEWKKLVENLGSPEAIQEESRKAALEESKKVVIQEEPRKTSL